MEWAKMTLEQANRNSLCEINDEFYYSEEELEVMVDDMKEEKEPNVEFISQLELIISESKKGN